MGHGERPRTQARKIAAARRASLRKVAERIGARIAVVLGVLGAAAADRIEHDDEAASHLSSLLRNDVGDVGVHGERGLE